MDDKTAFIQEVLALPYGTVISISAERLRDIFPPPRQPTLLEVVADIEAALSRNRDEYESQLPPDEAPQTLTEVIQAEIGEDFIVVQNHFAEDIQIERPISKCPHCRGSGFLRMWPDVRRRSVMDGPLPDPKNLVAPVNIVRCNHLPDPA